MILLYGHIYIPCILVLPHSSRTGIFPNLDDLNLFHNLAALNISAIFYL